MPQLNPSPWLMIFVLSWCMFLMVLPQKVATHAYLRALTPETETISSTLPWHWDWP